ncbi:lipase/acyltransferase domain-containing protein [Nocardia xishanensis]|uniref:lipase/acyltransferase domain-containing protein n=1 Tax=Nocardia xishanensis TaxID=238964 RepID=UPI00343CDAAA
MRDVVVLIPGIGGSVLARDGKELWAPTPGAVLRGVLSLGRSIKLLRLDGDDPAADDVDGVVATRVVPDLHIVPGLEWKIDGYTRCRQQLVERFGAVAGENYFEFPYDWRRDNRVAAAKLARSAHYWLRNWREKSGNADAKLVLIGHSMGGIVSRLYLEQLDGWKDTRTLITFGTPYSGSINALEFLANGFRKSWGPFDVDLSDLLRSFTSAYQLLPSYRCVAGPGGAWLNLDDPSLDWSRTGVDVTRLRAAVELHRGLRKQVDDRIAETGPGYEIRPVIGDFQPTRWAARFTDGGLEVLWARKAAGEDGGDGTVPKVSAVPHELMNGWRNASFVSQKHGSLQNDDPVLDHVGGVLRTAEFGGVDVFPAVKDPVALEVDDVTTVEPMVIRAKTAAEKADLVATVEDLGRGLSSTHPLIEASDGWRQATLAHLLPGDYRVTVAADTVHPVTELVSVVDLDDLARSVEGPG